MTDSPFPLYLSPSQISTMLTCGEQFRLTRVAKVPERPQWAGIGGSAVHRMTEDQDRARLNPAQTVGTWEDYWNEALDEAKERSPEYAPEDYYTGGRASKAWPNKEGPDWWAENGPKFVKSWAVWLENTDLEIWEYPNSDGELVPCIELEVMAEAHEHDECAAENHGGCLYVRSIIDRVLFDPHTGHLYIVDIKSGSYTAAWPQQLMLNNLGFKQHEACPTENGAQWAGFWKGRDGGIAHGQWTDLSQYTDDWVWQQVWNAKRMRDQELFVAQPTNLCKTACGVRDFCKAVGGSKSFFESPMQP